jgi:hypothetical protein
MKQFEPPRAPGTLAKVMFRAHLVFMAILSIAATWAFCEEIQHGPR